MGYSIAKISSSSVSDTILLPSSSTHIITCFKWDNNLIYFFSNVVFNIIYHHPSQPI